MLELELYAVPESGFITLDTFCKDPVYKEGTVLLFDTDDEFISFCIDPVIVIDSDAYYGKYTDMYQECLDAGMKFGIRAEDSEINKRKVASRKVKYNHRTVSVSVPARGIEELHVYDWTRKICDGGVYTLTSIVAKIVLELVYHHGKTPDDVRAILRSCCQEVLTREQYERLDEESKDMYRVFSIKRELYPYKKMTYRQLKQLFSVAAEYGIMVEDLVIKKR